ncbi:acyl-CoA synthetase (AMP-forming)/AMP-acid ligase II [Chitinivorax tropicus]|uniref:Acyl-CoA synthetase (AMP-forming)/AMP-acid ligase II n=1 Tax=Chitinivorax tropicus TaxID=714531 RepID=A0A840ML55_9PROT|nr:AMP-binding protein [Chitinivorax tropicus]MBB5017442.1 acyl-CoA synthetase (AMP-forming)/AMP-acid ligase II [Chitinivorax tropicus]
MFESLLGCTAPIVSDHIVAYTQRGTLGYAAFIAQVKAWYERLRTEDATHLALYEPDGATFAAMLLGAWHARKTVILPGNNLPATTQQLTRLTNLFAGDFPGVDQQQRLATMTTDPVVIELPPLVADHLGVMVFTSGSTGEPQAISKYLFQLANEVATLTQLFGSHLQQARIVATVSHQHIYGLLFKILWPLANQRAFLSDSLVFPEQFSVALAECPTVLVSSPAHLKRLPDTMAWQAAAQHTQAIFSSAGPLPEDAIPLVESKLGRTPIEVYGSSETGGIAWRQRPHGTPADWLPLPGITLGEQNGMLCLRSPHLADENWFQTADRISLNEQGGFQLQGRGDLIAKIEGKRVSLIAIEQALEQHAWVQQAKVLMLAEQREQVAAVVVLSQAGLQALQALGKTVLARQLRQSLASSVEAVALPRRWRFVGQLPADSQGKHTHALLSTLFAPTHPETTVLTRADGQISLQMTIQPDLLCFDGHFPRTPVLPGVAQVDWVMREGRRHFEIPGSFVRMEALKFQRIIQPGMVVTLDLTWRSDKQSLSFTLSSSAGQHASGRLIFG